NNCVLYATRFDPATSVIETAAGRNARTSLAVSPNPFSPVTSIILPEVMRDYKTRATLQVFTPGGRLVADLSKEISSKGKIAWNGGSLPVGIYFVKYKAGSKIWQTKAVLVR
ncbi:MAG: T9SS type A sorting domain-containing protein, partial [Fibrobacteres bacterium]|nr:T9SS type A sorting domain-containing protein [Fibrobacterota bacterium]